MNKTNWVMVVIVALVVAVIASVGTLAITGNTIKVTGTSSTTSGWLGSGRTTTTTAEVYTKAEVDAMFKQLGPAAYWGNLTNADYYNLKNLQNSASNAINQGVLNMLNNKCIINNPAGEFINSSFIIGSSICKKYNKDYNKNTTCVFAETAIGGGGDMISQVIPCNSDINVSIWTHVMCCSP